MKDFGCNGLESIIAKSLRVWTGEESSEESEAGRITRQFLEEFCYIVLGPLTIEAIWWRWAKSNGDEGSESLQKCLAVSRKAAGSVSGRNGQHKEVRGGLCGKLRLRELRTEDRVGPQLQDGDTRRRGRQYQLKKRFEGRRRDSRCRCHVRSHQQRQLACDLVQAFRINHPR